MVEEHLLMSPFLKLPVLTLVVGKTLEDYEHYPGKDQRDKKDNDCHRRTVAVVMIDKRIAEEIGQEDRPAIVVAKYAGKATYTNGTSALTGEYQGRIKYLNVTNQRNHGI